jgi:hypothetical protein
MLHEEISGYALTIRIENGTCTYQVDDVIVAREDYLACLATVRTAATEHLSQVFNEDNGVPNSLSRIADELSYDNEDSFARLLVQAASE